VRNEAPADEDAVVVSRLGAVDVPQAERAGREDVLARLGVLVQRCGVGGAVGERDRAFREDVRVDGEGLCEGELDGDEGLSGGRVVVGIVAAVVLVEPVRIVGNAVGVGVVVVDLDDLAGVVVQSGTCPSCTGTRSPVITS